jgi:hypothetical protein
VGISSRIISVFFATFFAGFFAMSLGVRSAQSADQDAKVAELLAHVQCSAQVQQVLQNWVSSAHWLERATDMDNGRVFATPTDKIGVWVSVSVYPSGRVEASRIAPDLMLRVHWKKEDCTPQMATSVRSEKGANGEYLTDADLKAELSKAGQALIYAWSPNMPLSVIGFPQAQEIAKNLRIKFIPVMDPETDEAYAKKIVSEKHLPESALRRSSSVELGARQMGLHYPSTLVYSKGKFSRLYPGYWVTAEVYRNFVKENLQ